MRHPETREPATDVVTAPPAHCPSCRSSDVRTTSKVVTAETYWRCEACGEVWNDGRRRAADRYTVDRPWGR